MGRKRKSASVLRDLVAEWCEAHGGQLVSPTEYNSVIGGQIGGRYVLDSRYGRWQISLPSDGDRYTSIHTRFLGDGPYPSGASASGKYNFGPVSIKDEGEQEDLFTSFRLIAQRLVEE